MNGKRPMSEQLDRLEREYSRVLGAYLKAGDESALSRAYELGRRAMVEGMGVLDMAVLHCAAVEELVSSSAPADQHRLTQAAADIFKELLSPYEMSFRGFREANEELQRLNESLRKQKEAVEVANRELESFSYSVSHDLRTPLTAIDGFSHILLEDFAQVLDDDGKRCLRNITAATQHMAQLIDDLLSLARVKFGEVHRVDVDFSALATSIGQRLRARWPQRDVHFDVQQGVRASGDAHLLAVLLENLLGNAWKFTSKREQAKISFTSEQRDGGPVYAIQDNGAGFDMTYAGKLFTPFQRLHLARDFEGTGIGLAIVRRVVDRHGGRIWAEGKVDRGATFHFTLGSGRVP
jgi:light-regulated signal transduction histidine kinase (bacteriophytochrome)